MTEKRKFHHLPPLPGTVGNYLQTVDHILGALLQHTFDDRRGLVNWLMRTFEIAQTSAIGYVQFLARLELITFKRAGSVAITYVGRDYLEAGARQKREIIAKTLLIRACGVLEILNVFAHDDEAHSLLYVRGQLAGAFPYWRSRAPYGHRILWLLSLGCIEHVDVRTYQITSFGRGLLEQHLRRPSASREPPLIELIEELDAASTDTEHPSRFERGLATAFRFLGFGVTEIGTPGDTDLLVTALAGSCSYTAIIDAKTRADGRLRDLPTYALQEHKNLHKVDHVIVIAVNFAEGRVLRQATEAEITLMTFSTVIRWLKLHAETPLNLTVYRSLFAASGIIDHLPTVVIDAAAAKRDLTKLLTQIVALMNETASHGLQQPLSSEQWFAMLVTKLQSVHYSATQVQEALVFLAHPLVAAAIRDNEGYMLTMNQSSLSLTLRELANQFNLQLTR